MNAMTDSEPCKWYDLPHSFTVRQEGQMRRTAVMLTALGFFAFGCLGYFVGSAHLLAPVHSLAADDCQTFPATGFQVCGDFLAYWRDHGALAQQGYPVSAPFQEKSDTDGKTYTVQYFERA